MILKMAWRNIWRNKLRSLVIMLSVVIGLVAGFFVLALYKGMIRSRIRIVIDSEVGHLQIHNPSFKKDFDPVFVLPTINSPVAMLTDNKEVKAFALRSIAQGMVATTTGSAGIQINGIDVSEEKRVSMLDKKIQEGHCFDSGKKAQVLVSRKLAKKLKLKIGNKLVLTFMDTSVNMVSAAFRVAGIFESQNAPLDERNVYIRRKELNELLGIGEGFHEVSVLLKNDDSLAGFQRLLQNKFPGLLTESWKEISPETELMAATVDSMSLIIIVIILFALAFGIINTMLMAVLERTHEIGLMMALGLNKWKLFRLVFSETILLTFVGVPVGWLLSRWLIVELHRRGLDFSTMGKEVMASFGFSNVIYPEWPGEKLVMVLMVVASAAIFSCIFPALKALRLRPMDALRK